MKMKRNVVFRVMEHISACMGPVIPALLAGGLLKLALLLLDFSGILGILGDTGPVLTAVSNAPFYFLPVLLAVSCAQRFNTSAIYALTAAGALLLPEFTALLEKEGGLGAFGWAVAPAGDDRDALDFCRHGHLPYWQRGGGKWNYGVLFYPGHGPGGGYGSGIPVEQRPGREAAGPDLRADGFLQRNLYTFSCATSILMFSDGQDPGNLVNAVIVRTAALFWGFGFTLGARLLESKGLFSRQ